MSNRLLNMSQDWNLHTHMEGLKNNMKLILVVLNIPGVKNIGIGKQNIEIYVGNNSAENPKKHNFLSEFGNGSMENELKKDMKFEQIVENIELFAIILAMQCKVKFVWCMTSNNHVCEM